MCWVTLVFSLTTTMMFLAPIDLAIWKKSRGLQLHCFSWRQRRLRLAPAVDSPAVPCSHEEQRRKAAPGRPRRNPQMVADLGQSPRVEQLPPAHDHGHGMDEQRETVAHRTVKSEQQR